VVRVLINVLYKTVKKGGSLPRIHLPGPQQKSGTIMLMYNTLCDGGQTFTLKWRLSFNWQTNRQTCLPQQGNFWRQRQDNWLLRQKKGTTSERDTHPPSCAENVKLKCR